MSPCVALTGAGSSASLAFVVDFQIFQLCMLSFLLVAYIIYLYIYFYGQIDSGLKNTQRDGIYKIYSSTINSGKFILKIREFNLTVLKLAEIRRICEIKICKKIYLNSHIKN